ncbi:MAG: hypothetical protein MJZ23_10220 [Paludibacteraceae bacterium]|nr:hypothetical protein [Paludibacteraceae bacterium]
MKGINTNIIAAIIITFEILSFTFLLDFVFVDAKLGQFRTRIKSKTTTKVSILEQSYEMFPQNQNRQKNTHKKLLKI